MTGSAARKIVEDAVRRELFGPLPTEEPRGKALDCSTGSVVFSKREDSWGIWHDAATGEEILTESTPLRRYGIGVLFAGSNFSSGDEGGATGGDERENGSGDSWDSADEVNDALLTGLSTGEGEIEGEVIELDVREGSSVRGDADSDDFDLTDANSFKPSAMAISFECDAVPEGALMVEVSGAYYDRLTVDLPGLSRPVIWWVRRPFVLSAVVTGSELLDNSNRLFEAQLEPRVDLRVKPSLKVFSRPLPGAGADSERRLVTLAVVNSTPGSGPSVALFQVGFCVKPDGKLSINPYPEADQRDPDDEELSIALLYRKLRTYAIGHGCAAIWEASDKGFVESVSAEALPAYEVSSLTPDIYITGEDGMRSKLSVSMEALADGTAEGIQQVEGLLRHYGAWIDARDAEIGDLPELLQPTAQRHLKLCREALIRMQSGWELAKTDPIAGLAFRLMNRAMLQQQLRSNFERRPVMRLSDGTLEVVGEHPVPNAESTPYLGKWRPFQIAFVLACLPEVVFRNAPTRSIVDLIFFPTGGGKTEAYLAASALSLLSRRLHDKNDVGTDTLMRYTLRLLTSQQFIRAAALICVLEDIRSKNEEVLGEARFGIGVWLGASSTPNRWKGDGGATANLSQLISSHAAQNKFLLLRCPWCGAQMGPLRKEKAKKGEPEQDVIGYEKIGNKVRFACIDPRCEFGLRNSLPIHVVDEDIYEVQPSIVIGTVDKFAMLAWRPEARALFGIDSSGNRVVSPPGLIIQDELHLISGPLGSMVGIYEPVIDELCTDYRQSEPVLPKIIASTATIRRYEDQIRALYGRTAKRDGTDDTQVALFPPHGLEEGKSFFAEPAKLESGEPAPGRRYLGVMSPSLGSTQTVQVRVAAATLQAGLTIPEADRDGYWTNLNFLNSLRELGNTVSLIQSDIPDYLTGLRRRENLADVRWPRSEQVMELTSRRRADDIPKALEQLEVPYGEANCIDICLASNIIEVGVDINRLGLMTIVGQPKTTAQYIQVSGRVGRRFERSPGLVITIYGAAKPRDRSHYERFSTYHQQLYAQVEPTSVTPFAEPVLRRAMHASVISYMRQSSYDALPVFPFPETEYDEAVELLRKRAQVVDSAELPALEKAQLSRKKNWVAWKRTEWNANVNGGNPKQGLMRYAGTLPDLSAEATVWDVPTSMRNVDAECRLTISLDYSIADGAAREDGTQ